MKMQSKTFFNLGKKLSLKEMEDITVIFIS